MQDTSLTVSIPCTATIALSLVGESESAGAPRILALDPCVVKPGTVVTAIGMDLDRHSVAGVFLSDVYFDWKAEIVQQSENVLRFRIPEHARTGTQRILLLAAGRQRTLIDPSVVVTVD